jgi:hypothetical protein
MDREKHAEGAVASKRPTASASRIDVDPGIGPDTTERRVPAGVAG